MKRDPTSEGEPARIRGPVWKQFAASERLNPRLLKHLNVNFSQTHECESDLAAFERDHAT
jgi:hypothetical protein